MLPSEIPFIICWSHSNRFTPFLCGFVFYSQKGGKPLPHDDSFKIYGSIFVLNTCSPSTYSRIVADLTGLWFSSIVTFPETSEIFSVASNASLIASGSCYQLFQLHLLISIQNHNLMHGTRLAFSVVFLAKLRYEVLDRFIWVVR